MQVTVNIKTCRSCHHVDHSGSYTVRGARPICGHSDACKVRTLKRAFLREYPEYSRHDEFENFKYHWIHRVLMKSSKEEPKEIPTWCPLKHGAGY